MQCTSISRPHQPLVWSSCVWCIAPPLPSVCCISTYSGDQPAPVWSPDSGAPCTIAPCLVPLILLHSLCAREPSITRYYNRPNICYAVLSLMAKGPFITLNSLAHNSSARLAGQVRAAFSQHSPLQRRHGGTLQLLQRAPGIQVSRAGVLAATPAVKNFFRAASWRNFGYIRIRGLAKKYCTY